MDKIRYARRTANPGRRAFLGLTAAGLAVPLGAMAPASWRTGRSSTFDALGSSPICRAAAEAVAPGATPREIRLCWNANAVCQLELRPPICTAYFARHNLKVERINFSGASDQLLELLASGKADAGVGMALGWLKPLEQGFDVKLTAALHGGCIRLLTSQQSGITEHRRTEGQGDRDVQHGEPGSRISYRSWRPRAVSIRSRISTGASTPLICSASHCRRARSRHFRAAIRSRRSSATATIWLR